MTTEKNTHKKSEVTRERILEAAKEVFSELPYNSASMRMIGSAGDFDHPLIRYYFKTKADLFEAVVEHLCEEYYQNYVKWFDGLNRLSLRDSLALFIDRFLDYNFKHPEAVRMISLNIPIIDELSDVPGYQHIIEVLRKTRVTFEEILPGRAPSEDVEKYISSFNSLAILYLGTAPCQAAILELDAQGHEYRIWVKETLIYVFLPSLKKLFFPG